MVENTKEREELVAKVKAKILAEIEEEWQRYVADIRSEEIIIPEEELGASIDLCAFAITALAALREFISSPRTFMWVSKYVGDEAAYYQCPGEILSIMLKDEFKVAARFVCHSLDDGDYNFEKYLRDNIFGFKMVTAMDTILYADEDTEEGNKS